MSTHGPSPSPTVRATGGLRAVSPPVCRCARPAPTVCHGPIGRWPEPSASTPLLMASWMISAIWWSGFAVRASLSTRRATGRSPCRQANQARTVRAGTVRRCRGGRQRRARKAHRRRAWGRSSSSARAMPASTASSPCRPTISCVVRGSEVAGHRCAWAVPRTQEQRSGTPARGTPPSSPEGGAGRHLRRLAASYQPIAHGLHSIAQGRFRLLGLAVELGDAPVSFLPTGPQALSLQTRSAAWSVRPLRLSRSGGRPLL